MTRVLFGLACAAALCGCDGLFGSGKVETQDRGLVDFQGVDTSAPALKVAIAEGPEFSVTITTDTNIQRYIGTEVRDGVLLITFDADHYILTSTALEARVTLPELRSLRVTGVGVARVESLDAPHDLTLATEGKGVLDFSGDAGAIDVSTTETSKVTLVGSATALTTDVLRESRVTARDLPVHTAHLGVRGPGRVIATVLDSVTLAITGSGTIEWYGPALVSGQMIIGSGQVVHPD